LPRLVGLRLATERTLTNRVLDADEARHVGLVTRVVADEMLLTEAEALATQLAAGPTKAFGAAKRLLRASSTTSLEAQMAAESEAIATAGATVDGTEGIAAFVAKRAPTFCGR
jgi:2-(1,2-epoxy-1,2-dihydrophenyl)acetyl-CoA isomerase